MLHLTNGFVIWIETKQDNSSAAHPRFEVILLRLSGESSTFAAYCFSISAQDKPSSRIETVESYLESVQTSLAQSENISITEVEASGLNVKLWQPDTSENHTASSRRMQLAAKSGLLPSAAPLELVMQLFSHIQNRMIRSASEESMLRNQIREKNKDLIECSKEIASLSSARNRGLSESLHGLALILNEKNRLISSLQHAAEDPLKRKSSASSSGNNSHGASRDVIAQPSALVSNILSASMKKSEPKKEMLPDKKRKSGILTKPKKEQGDCIDHQDKLVVPSIYPEHNIAATHSESSIDVYSSASFSIGSSQPTLTQPLLVHVPVKKLKRSMYDSDDD
jgi:hypothetical protein